MSTDRLRGQLDLVLLGALADSPGHGYEVISTLRERSEGFLDLAEGSVYPALHRLEDQGLLASDWQPVSGRRRRVYRITPDGRTALRAQTRDWHALRAAVDRVLRPIGLADNPAASPA
ncbi:MAG TPA: helix-turn-helix transcriptional regulator [Actinomycetes bacterium]|nr:helix-turn-helix transcriptional regulator [Actinomycetes bacterium]